MHSSINNHPCSVTTCVYKKTQDQIIDAFVALTDQFSPRIPSNDAFGEILRTLPTEEVMMRFFIAAQEGF